MTEKNATFDYKNFFERDEDFMNQPRARKTIHKENFSGYPIDNPKEKKPDIIDKQIPDKAPDTKFSPNNNYQIASGGMSMLSQVLNTSDTKLNVGSAENVKKGKLYL